MSILSRFVEWRDACNQISKMENQNMEYREIAEIALRNYAQLCKTTETHYQNVKTLMIDVEIAQGHIASAEAQNEILRNTISKQFFLISELTKEMSDTKVVQFENKSIATYLSTKIENEIDDLCNEIERQQ